MASRTASLAAALTVLLAGTIAGQAGAALKQDPPRLATTPIFSTMYGRVEAGRFLAAVQRGEQIIDFEADGVNPSGGDTLFTFITVKPAGAAWQGFNFQSNPTPFSVVTPSGQPAAPFSNGGKQRVFDVEFYDRLDPGKGTKTPRIGYLAVANEGAFQRNWKWYASLEAKYLLKVVVDKNQRIVDIDRRSGSKYSAVVIKNTGSIARKWWFYVNVTTTFINDKLKVNKAGLTDIEPLGNGRYTVVMERSGLKPYYRVNRTIAQVAAFAKEKKVRVVDIELDPTTPGRYAAIFLPGLNGGFD